MRKMDKTEIADRVQSVAKLLGLEELLERRPGALSGGQRQRVAMGRAIVREPQAFLMDEPLSNLDAKLRVGMRTELARLHERLGITTVYVTHDQVEAMTLGQRVAVMRGGEIQQVDAPQNLYRNPANLFVAAFIGSPSMNLVEARIEDGHASFGGYRIPLSRHVPDGNVILGVRPQDFEDAALADPSLPSIEIEVAVVEELGSETHAHFRIDAPPVDAEAVRATIDEQDTARLIADEAGSTFTATMDEVSQVHPGKSMRLAVYPDRFHFFDVETGAALTSRDAAAV
jgi:multiple sugar transport system ATP-binding protein